MARALLFALLYATNVKRDNPGKDRRALTTERTLDTTMADELNKPIVTRQEAISAGLKRYFTGEACASGHLDEKLVSNKRCVVCHRASVVISHRKKRSGPDRNAALAADKVWRDKWKKTPGVMSRLRKQGRTGTANYRKKNPIIGRIDQANKRARKYQCVGVITVADVTALIDKQGNKCANCFIELDSSFHIDHVMPLSLLGDNLPHNLQIMCGPCNKKKHAMNPFDWARINGRLL